MGICNIAQMRVFYIQSVMGAVTPGISDPPCSLRSTPGASDPPWGVRLAPGASDPSLEPQIRPGASNTVLEPQIHCAAPDGFTPGPGASQIHPWSLRSTPGASDPWVSTPGASDPPLEPAPGVDPRLQVVGHRWYASCGGAQHSGWRTPGDSHSVFHDICFLELAR